jgi:hypothetical protein
LLHRFHVGEDRVGLLGLLQRFAFLDPLQTIVQAIEDVPQGAFAGQLRVGIALVDQGLPHFGGREVGVQARRLQSRVGVRMRFDDRAEIGRQLRVLLFAALPASRREVLPATHPVVEFVESLLDGVASPTEASFGQAGAAAAELVGHLGLEQSALVSCETSGARLDQGLEAFDGVFHEGDPP